jgi:hypothetical protein
MGTACSKPNNRAARKSNGTGGSTSSSTSTTSSRSSNGRRFSNTTIGADVRSAHGRGRSEGKRFSLRKEHIYATPQGNQNQKVSSQTLQNHRHRQGAAPRRGPPASAPGQKF